MVLVLNTPTRDHIASLAASFSDSPFFARFRSSRAEDGEAFAVHAVFHVCGDGVLEDKRYKSFMWGFRADVHVGGCTCFLLHQLMSACSTWWRRRGTSLILSCS